MRDTEVKLWARLNRMFNLRSGMDDAAAIDANIREGVETFGINLWVLILAMLVASIGLDVNSTAVIIGAMLISPLMGPIVGLGYGLALADFRLMRKAATTLLIFVLLSLGASTLYFLLSPLQEPGSELLARTRPSLWDVLIAFVGGSAGIIALTRKSFSNVLPGVAIATALMPPLCTVGYSLANAQWQWALGAFYLFIINGVFIALATLLFAKLLRLRPQIIHAERAAWLTNLATALTVVAVIVPSLYLAFEIVAAQRYASTLNRVMDGAARLGDFVVVARNVRPEARRVELTVAGKARVADVEAVLREAASREPALAGTSFIVRSLTGPQLDLGTIRKALAADLSRLATENNTEIRAELTALREQQTATQQAQATLVQIERELPAAFIEVESARAGWSARAADQPASLMVQVASRKPLSATQLKRMQAWLDVRMQGTPVILSSVVGKRP
ncbi:hypothetical protein IP84_13290 [beta proteobacterium AAP99]|nr:hypothetical protein IP84_13290 [beta proteobacterium AAP99]